MSGHNLNAATKLVYDHIEDFFGSPHSDGDLWEKVRASVSSEDSLADVTAYLVTMVWDNLHADLTFLDGLGEALLRLALSLVNFKALAYALRRDEMRRQGAEG